MQACLVRGIGERLTINTGLINGPRIQPKVSEHNQITWIFRLSPEAQSAVCCRLEDNLHHKSAVSKQFTSQSSRRFTLSQAREMATAQVAVERLTDCLVI